MKTFPHNPSEPDLAARFAADRQAFESLPAEAGQKEAHFHQASLLASNLAGLAYAFDAPIPEVKAYAQAATRFAAKAISFDGLIDIHTFQRYLSLAIWTGDGNFRGSLANWDRAQFTDPAVNADEIAYKAVEAIAAMAKGRPQGAAELAEAGLKRVTRGLAPTAVVNAVSPLLRMTEALGKGDLYGMRAAVGERTREYYRAAAVEAVRNQPEMLLDLTGLACLRMGAADAGLAVDAKSVYMPAGIFG